MEDKYKTVSDEEKILKLEIDSLIGKGFKLIDIESFE